MARHLVIAIALAAQALPVLAQEQAYDYQDDNGSAWADEAPPPPEDGSDAYASDPSRSDVNVDLATPGASVTFDTFQDGLAPYGEWVTVQGYGRVWRPHHVAADWRPYYYGRWEWTNEGWLWASDEPWGWAAYHYGRWGYEPSYGWIWVPGYQWAPAWVTWRYSPEYIGWAPLAPGFSVYVTTYPVHFGLWSFVPCNRFVGYPVHTVAFTGARVAGIFHGTMPAPPRATVFGARAPAWGGPARPFVEHSIGRPITPVRVLPVGSPSAVAGAARPGVLPIYRPEAYTGHGPAPAPSHPSASASAPGWRPSPRSTPTYNPAPWQTPQPTSPSPRSTSTYNPAPWRTPQPTSPSPRSTPTYNPAPRQAQPSPRQGSQYSPLPRQLTAPATPRSFSPAPQHSSGGGGHAPKPSHQR